MSSHFGPQVFRSDDLGASWDETPNGAIRFPEDTGAVARAGLAARARPALKSPTSSTPAPSRRRCSAATTAARRSRWSARCWDHPHREQWGAGFGGQAIHTVLPHHDDPQQHDGRDVDRRRLPDRRRRSVLATRQRRRQGLLPARPVAGVRAVRPQGRRHPGRPERMYLQNHHGVYRTDDGGEHWESIADGLPSDFGFPIVVDPHDPDTIYVFPLVADGERIPPEAKPAGLEVARRRRDLDRARARGCPRTTSTPASCATRCAPTTPSRPGSTSASATARLRQQRRRRQLAAGRRSTSPT